MNKSTMLKDVIRYDERGHFGHMLKYWRKVHKISQEELASRIDSASRHIGRLENGGAQPSKEMVTRIAETFSLGHRDTINLLFAAGYTKRYNEANILHPDYKYQREEVILGLKALEPNPAIVIDMTGEFLMVNRAWAGFQQQLDPKGELSNITNIFDFLFSYTEKYALNQEWSGTMSVALLWLQQSLCLHGDKQGKVAALIERIETSPSMSGNWQQEAASREGGQRSRFNFLLNDKIQGFLIHTYIENLLGPLAFSAMPDMLVVTFCAEDPEFDLSSLVKPTVKHPLLLY